ncbi:MAG: amidohydrolase [Roseococcus sp.]
MADALNRRDFLAAASAATALAPAGAMAQATAPDPGTLYVNGQILTMEGDAPAMVEAVAVRDGRILFAGPRDAARAAAPDARLVDLQGRTMLPGFIDTWGHFLLFAQQTLGVNLAYFADDPPRNKADLIRLLRATPTFNGWITGYGYSEALLSDGPPTLADLDAAFPETPVLIGTLSTLTGKANSAGLAKLGLTPTTPAAQPGMIAKDPTTGRLTGDLLFTPYLLARAAALSSYSQAQAFQTFRAAEGLLARQGFTTVQSYQLMPGDLPMLRAAFDQGVISLDVMGLPAVSDAASGQMLQQTDWRWGSYSHGDHGLKVAGYQVVTDAAPQLRLAAFTQPYADTRGFPDGWKGSLLPREQVEQWVTYAYANDIPFFGYSNGDAGIDLCLSAIEKAIATTGKTGDRRSIIAHSYFARPDQLARYKQLEIGASMMPLHMTVYGDQQLGLLGPARANKESPMATALALGVRTTLHCDYPSASPSVMETIWSAVTRTTLTGRVMGPEEALSPYAALQGVTSKAAYNYREEGQKGTITAGKIADLVILDGNPLSVAPAAIKDIKVMETIKRGRTIYRRG